MTSGNGDDMPHFVLGKRGRICVQYAKGFPEKILDVMVLSNQWHDIDRSFRDENNQVPADRVGDLQTAALSWFQRVLEVPDDAGATWAEANHLIALITAESRKLQDFFESVSGIAPVSRASTELTFSDQEID